MSITILVLSTWRIGLRFSVTSVGPLGLLRASLELTIIIPCAKFECTNIQFMNLLKSLNSKCFCCYAFNTMYTFGQSKWKLQDLSFD